MPELGKYTAEVLAAYGVSLALLVLLVLVTLRRGGRAGCTTRRGARRRAESARARGRGQTRAQSLLRGGRRR